MWNQQEKTGTTIPNNKQDIVIRDNEKGMSLLRDTVTSGNKTVTNKQAEKILKHKELTLQIQRMWNIKTN